MASNAHLIEHVRAGDVEGVRAVLRVHPELVNRESPSHPGYVPLHYAVLQRMPDMVRTLMQFGADPHVTTAGIYALREAATPLSIATERGYEEIAAILRKADRHRESQPPAPPAEAPDELCRAVESGDEDLVIHLVKQLPDLTPRDDQGWLLRVAVDCDRPDLLRLLLDLRLDPDARVRVEGEDPVVFSWGMPLYECARYGKHEMAEMLLQRGADPNAQVYASGTPLSEAYGQRDEKMVALLERFGGKTNASMAGLYRRADIARQLLEEHGDAELPDDGFSKGRVAHQLLGAAARGGDPEILQMALERVDIPDGDPRWNALLQAPLQFWNHWIGPWCHHEWDRGAYLTGFKLILERCGPPNAGLHGGATILHQIVVMGDHVRPEERVAFAKAALDAGGRLNLRDDLLKSTPLGWACRWGRSELVELFLQHGADPVELDAEPWATPLAWAEKKNHSQIAAMLRPS